MNHLAHFKVGHPHSGLMVGGLLGDFVKGRLDGAFPLDIERGIRLHRAVDVFSDRHPITKRSVQRFAPEFRRYGPIMVDVIFDHFLASHWQQVCDGSLTSFCDEVFDSLLLHEESLPENAKRVASYMARTRAREDYGNKMFIDRSLTSISSRLKRDNPLHRAMVEFEIHQAELLNDFTLFFPALMDFSASWQYENSRGTK